MSDIKSSLKTAGLIGTFGQVMGTGNATEECWRVTCTAGCTFCVSTCTVCSTCTAVTSGANKSLQCEATCISLIGGC